MFEYLPETEQPKKEERQKKTGERSSLLDLMIYRTIVSIIIAAVLLVLKIAYPSALRQLSDAFAELTRSVTPADSVISEAADTFSGIMSSSPSESTNRGND